MVAKGNKETLGSILDALTIEGALYEVEDPHDKRIRCYACGHRCLIKDGRRGICQVRFNDNGVLRVPHGYVGALQVDPIEKKPFFHALPGTDALSFGMLGCDYHCHFCFAPNTPIITENGVQAIEDLFQLGPSISQPDGDIAFPTDLKVVSGSGQLRRVDKVFKHPYRGSMTVIKPYYLPEIVCTPDHRVYATDDPTKPLEKIQAQKLTKNHWLGVPRNYDIGAPQTINIYELLSSYKLSFKVHHKFSSEEVAYVLEATTAGQTSRQIGATLGKDASYIRHVRSKIWRGKWNDRMEHSLVIENNLVRFSKEHRPGLPMTIELDERFARLLGYYCAEGSIQQGKTRPNSYTLSFTFGPDEQDLVQETQSLLGDLFGVATSVVKRETTLGVHATKSSLALVIMSLCGTGSAKKHVPYALLNAPTNVIKAFLDAYISGDGHQTPKGKIGATTKSRALAYGIALLALKSGHLASVYANDVPTERIIEDRKVNQLPIQYSIVWYTSDTTIKRRYITTEDFYLIPFRSISEIDYDGDVYNLEVEVEHNYLANFMLVSNCQNWLTSQTLRDDNAGVMPHVISTEGLVELTKQRRAKSIASTYNEPLITTEWAVDVFKVARQSGLRTLYISNGNATPEALSYLRPYIDAYKIDLKTMNDANYRKVIGGVLQNVLDTIKMAHDLGIWVEVVTLVIPGMNDSTDELWDAARYIHSVSPDIPWHVTAFHPDYKMDTIPRTTVDTLLRAAEIGTEAGLNYVYAGNLPGKLQSWEDTRCPSCQMTVIRRIGFTVLENRIGTNGTCPKCQTHIPGLWV